MLNRKTIMQSVVTIAVLAVAMRVQPVKEIVLNESKFLGIF